MGLLELKDVKGTMLRGLWEEFGRLEMHFWKSSLVSAGWTAAFVETWRLVPAPAVQIGNSDVGDDHL